MGRERCPLRGKHARVLATGRIVHITAWKRDYKPGNEVMTDFYYGKDVITDEAQWYWDSEVRGPVNPMEVIAWASSTRTD